MNRFNDLYDVNSLQKSLEDINANSNNNNNEYPEVPVGKYEVKIEKIELAGTREGNKPMGKVQFRIIEGEYKNSCLFYNQVLIGTDKKTGLLSAFGIHNFNLFLKSLEPLTEEGLDRPIVFKDFKQYEQLLLDVAEDVESSIYEIQYGKNNDFATFKVLGIYEE